MNFLLHFISLILSKGNYLTYLANLYHSDKGNFWGNRHNYTKYYHKYFKSIRHKQDLNVLEIGLCRGLNEGWKQNDVPSLRIWLKYFPYATIYGFDCSDFSFFKHNKIYIYKGDQGNINDLRDFISKTKVEFDLIIDDGSHASHHQQISLGILFPHVKKGGFYVIEDMDWQPSEIEKEESVRTEKLLLSFKQDGKFSSQYLTKSENKYLSSNILRCDMINKNRKHFKMSILKKISS